MKKENYCIIFLTFFGLIGSILAGLIFYRKDVFVYTQPAFQFIINGFIGALFFGLLEHTSVKTQISGVIFMLIFVLLFSIKKTPTTAYFIRNIFYLGGLLLSVKLYHQVIKRNSKIIIYLRSFLLVFFYSVLNVLSGILVYLINAKDGFPPLTFIYSLVLYGVLIGLGTGIGIDFYLQNEKRIFRYLRI